MTNEISKFLQERINAGDFPSAVYLVAEKGEIVMHEALGFAVVEPERIKARIDTIYDMASLTKVLVTGLLMAILIERQKLSLLDKISDYMPEFSSEEKNQITVGNLLSHSSGLVSWLPLYLLTRSVGDIIDFIGAHQLDCSSNSKVLYSDLNFIVLAKLIEKMEHGRRIDLIANERIFDSLKLSRTDFNPRTNDYGKLYGLADVGEIAASEKGNEFERQTCIEKGFLDSDAKNPVAIAPGSDALRTLHSAFRDYQIWGEVHDGNAYFMRGVAGHAGLFSTAEEVFKIAQQFLPNYSTLLKPETCKLFRTNFTPGMNEHRSLAFQLATTPESAAGKLMSPQSFGHLGFTGTSLWIDPVAERVFILLTNRTHNHPLPFVNLNSVRRRFHDLAIGQLERNS